MAAYLRLRGCCPSFTIGIGGWVRPDTEAPPPPNPPDPPKHTDGERWAATDLGTTGHVSPPPL